MARILEAEEEEERKAKEAEEAKEKAWVERFPFEPTYHPEITFDPTIYDPNNWRPPEERCERHEEMQDWIGNHSFLRMFYESRLPYTKEFEQMYDIVKEEFGEEKASNPIILGKTFNTLMEYHKAKAQDPDAIYRENAQVAVPRPPPPRQTSMLEGLTPEQLSAYKALPESERRAMTEELRASRSKEMREQLRAYHAPPEYQVKDITWGEEAESLKKPSLARYTISCGCLNKRK